MYTEYFDKMRNQIHRLMGEFFKEAKPLVGYQADESFHPPMDIYETEANLVIVMEIAGMRTEDMNVLFEKDHLSISGTRAEACPTPKTRLHQMEIDYGYFERTLRIPFPFISQEGCEGVPPLRPEYFGSLVPTFGQAALWIPIGCLHILQNCVWSTPLQEI